jgi:RNA polymerase sigma factor (sigma-70 family)
VSPTPFRPLSDAELNQLSDDELLAHMRAARDAGANEDAKRALQILVFGCWGLVESRLSMRLPEWAVEEETEKVIVRAITSSFAGESVGEFRSWLSTIIKRAAADFHRSQERVPQHTPLDDAGDDGPASHRLGVFEPDGAGYVETQILLESCLDELSDPHRRVVELMVFEGRDASEAAAQVPGMTASNAYQIVSRFRRRLRALLEEDNR